MSNYSGGTFFVHQEAPANALDLSKDFTNVVLAGRAIFKVFRIEETYFWERINLRPVRNLNLNYSSNDVVWSPSEEQLLATAATNGAVVLWNLNVTSKCKMYHVFMEHKRTVNKVNFHPLDPVVLVSGSQDSSIKLFDIRLPSCVCTMGAATLESVRDVQFSPHAQNSLASVAENGRVYLWDTRRPERPEKSWAAHSEYVFACDWHPEIRNCLATAGRDKMVKLWNTDDCSMDSAIHTIAPVGRIKWRPNTRMHIASTSLALDFSVNVWDVRRAFVPFAAFREHKDVTTGIAWRGDLNTILSTSRDGTLYHHNLDGALRPGDRMNPVGLDMNLNGLISHASRDTRVYHSGKLCGSLIEVDNSRTNGSNSGHSTPSFATKFKRASPNFGVAVTGSDESIESGGSSSWRLVSPSYKTRMFRRRTSFVAEPYKSWVSQLRLFSEKSGDTSDAEGTMSNAWIVECAKRYKIEGGSLSWLCEHNARVAESVGRREVALSWLTLKTLFGAFNFESAAKDICKKNQEEGAGDDRGRHSSTTNARRVSGLNSQSGDAGLEPLASSMTTTNIGQTKPSESRRSSRVMLTQNGVLDSEAASDSEETDLDDGLNLGVLANGSMTQDDFFDDAVWAPVKFDSLVHHDPGSIFNAAHEWNIKNEAFELKHELKESTTHDEASADNFLINSVESAQSEDELGSSVVETLTVEAMTDSLLCVEDIRDFPHWSTDNTLKETIHYFVDTGDVQSAVTMYLVLGHARIKHLFNEQVIEDWFLSYIELLQRFQRFNEAAMIIAKSPVPSVSELSLTSTNFCSNCTHCSKALSGPSGAWFCERCRVPRTVCAVCHKTVKGLFVWCQGCGHGGHPHHLRDWFANRHRECPTGCGHYCEFQ